MDADGVRAIPSPPGRSDTAHADRLHAADRSGVHLRAAGDG